MKICMPTLFTGLLFATAALAEESAKPADPTPVAKADSNECTWSSTIRDWKRLDDKNLIVWGPGKQAYHVQLSFPLFGLNSAEGIALVDRDGNNQICGYGMDRIAVPDSPVHSDAVINGITRLDEAGIAQLAEKYKVRWGKKKPKPQEAGDEAENQERK